MFGVLDLTTVAIIQKKLEELSRCPDHLDFLLCGFTRDTLLVDLVGVEYIKQARDFVMNNRITVLPYYALDLKSVPVITVISSGVESEKFIGDNGWTSVASNRRILPVTIAQWDADSYDGPVLHASSDYDLIDKLWPGLIVKSKNLDTGEYFSARIQGITEDGSLCLSEDIPSNVSLKGWIAETGGQDKIRRINSSIDEVQIAIQLTTHGDPSVHRLLSVVLRYIIKSSRLIFDKYGLHDARLAYQPMTPSGQEELEFQSVYTIEGKFADHWIASEEYSLDSATNITVAAVATNDNPKDEDVELD